MKTTSDDFLLGPPPYLIFYIFKWHSNYLEMQSDTRCFNTFSQEILQRQLEHRIQYFQQ